MTTIASPALGNASEMTPAARIVRHTMVPLVLLITAPPMMMVTWYVHTQLGGSLLELWHMFAAQGFFTSLSTIWGPVFFGSAPAWTMLGGFAVLQLALMRLLPGKEVTGPTTPSGHTPTYTDNGVAAFAITLALFAAGSWGLGWFSPAVIYDHFGAMLGALNLFALLFCGALYLKGRFAPSPGEHGLSGNFIFDYYWGVELYPRLAGWDIKMFTNCRLGMMGWPLIIISFAAKQHELGGITDGMLVAVGLQLIYIAKFFWWEAGYMRSLDIIYDRAGFYICWGVLVWLPCVYTAATLYQVNQPSVLGWPIAVGIFVLGIAAIVINYQADRQRQLVRATGGKAKVWGKDPQIIIGRYVDDHGENKESLLLASGWWGVARHFNYLPELTAAFCWTVPVLFDNLLPWFYMIFLVILLTDRSFRDDKRCAQKYGADWETYRQKVPYKILPGVF